MKSQLIQLIQSKKYSVGIVGLGYVGLPLALRFAEIGIKVIGFDIDKIKINSINAGNSYIKHISNANLAKGCAQGFFATSDFSHASEVDALIVCVPTPLGEHNEPDLSFVINTTDSLLPYLRTGQLFSLESTTYPGTTDEVIKPRIESRGLKVGEDIFLVFSPEREDPGNPNFTTQTIPKIVGGATIACLNVGVTLYSQAVDSVVTVSSCRAAEMTKLLENIHRAVNIGLVNEMKILADAMNIDIYEIIRAASTKPFGFTPYYPGPGLGGHCIPIDPFYLTWKAREFGLHTRFIELAGEINSDMPKWVISKLADALNNREKSIKGSRILVLGLAYKKNIDDMRESPSVELMELLVAKGASVSYSDPWVSVFPKMRKHYFDLNSIELTPENIASYDAILLSTNHDAFDYDALLRYSKLIVDTRGVYLSSEPNVVKA
jgi:UDP-N-acetyl-D-glucosamine dehydrogenase